ALAVPVAHREAPKPHGTPVVRLATGAAPRRARAQAFERAPPALTGGALVPGLTGSVPSSAVWPRISASQFGPQRWMKGTRAMNREPRPAPMTAARATAGR